MSTRLAVIIVLIALALYGLIEARPLLLGPSLNIVSPVDGATIEGGVVAVSGVAVRTTALTLNGAPLLPDEKGAFSSTLTLSAGTSILTFTASDRFGRTITLTRTIFVP